MAHRPLKSVTIHDVARLAGVSTSTVSRVLDDRHPRIRSPAAERVRKAARELGYRRDALASSLRRRGTSTVGVLVPRLTDTVMAILFEEIGAVCEQRSLFALVANTGDEPARERVAVERLLARRVDGLILTTSRTGDNLPEQLRERGVPHVLALRTDGTSPSAVGDDELGGYLATRHLLDLGHRDIGLVAGPGYASSARDRRAGYERALREAGVEIKPGLARESAFSVEAGEKVGRALLTSGDRPTAIFAVNDNTAIGVMSAANRLGLSVPADLSVVGYNDIPVVSHLPVPLTSVRVPFAQIARDAVELLLRSVEDEGDEDRGVVRRAVPTLIPRASSRNPPG
jgi:LacI family transcriptional regulator